jgi:hypothetical protein
MCDARQRRRLSWVLWELWLMLSRVEAELGRQLGALGPMADSMTGRGPANKTEDTSAA